MKKKVFLFLIMMAMIFSLGGCFKKEESDAVKFKEEYESLNGEKSKSGKIYPEVSIDEDNIVEYIDMKEASELIQNNSGVFYFGFPECPWCRNAVPMLLQAADNTDIDKIYYINMYDKRDIRELDEDGNVVTTQEGSDGYSELTEVLDSILLDYTIEDEDGNEISLGEKRVYVPLVVFVKDGKIVDYHMDTVTTQEDPYVLLNEDEQTELYQIYVNGIHEVLGDVCEEEEHC